MNRPVALLLGLAAIFVLSGCMEPMVPGNEIGGAIPMAGLTRQQAAEMARAHCAKYGRSSRILAIRSDAGNKAVFECAESSLSKTGQAPRPDAPRPD